MMNCDTHREHHDLNPPAAPMVDKQHEGHMMHPSETPSTAITSMDKA